MNQKQKIRKCTVFKLWPSGKFFTKRWALMHFKLSLYFEEESRFLLEFFKLCQNLSDKFLCILISLNPVCIRTLNILFTLHCKLVLPLILLCLRSICICVYFKTISSLKQLWCKALNADFWHDRI